MNYRAATWIALVVTAGLTAGFTSEEEEQMPPLTQAHAHNDYNHHRPLFDALDHGFASVEADIYLVEGQLLVAHNRKDVKSERTLLALYLDPLRARAKKFGGRIYPNGDPTFYLLIDTKTDADTTFVALDKVLHDYADIITQFDGTKVEPKAITVVLTGNRPRHALPKQTVRLAALDAQMPDLDQPNPGGIFLWMSEDWKHFFKWNGQGKIPDDQKADLQDIVSRSHDHHMKVRFWNAPQSTNFWTELRNDGVDLLNADDLVGLEKFLRAK